MNHRRGVRYCVAAAAITASALSRAADAQVGLRTTPRREAGVGLEYSQPVGDFRQNVRHGFGAGGHFVFGLDPQGVIGIRADAGYINYGNETHYLVFSSSIRRVLLRAETSNNIFVGSVGPQLTLPIGRVRPYLNAGIGVAYFYTQTSLSDDDGSRQLAQTTNYSHNSLAYTGGAGFNIPLVVESQPFALDVGARYNSVDKARYLTRGDIIDDPNDPYGVIITPHESAANFVTYHLGVSVRF
jgi:opacity protein-like surface antigen